MTMNKTTDQRFWEKVNKTDGCWLWISALDRGGYGRFWLDGKVREAHRVAFSLIYGVIPHGLFVCHSCDNPRCVNPAHLWLGTAGDNVRDMHTKGRRVTGIRRIVDKPQKLNREKVITIRAIYANGDSSQSALGRMFNVRQQTIGEIVRREIWNHI